jgi:hypothetical protein
VLLYSIPVRHPLSDRFALIIDGLCRAVAARAPGQRDAAPLLVLLWSWLRRLDARFARLAARAFDGALRVCRQPAMRAARPARTDRRWPAGFAWLVRLVPEAAAFGSQLGALLADPDMAALFAAAPRARRLFGPLGRMLAVPGMASPPRPAASRVMAIQSEPTPVVASGVPYWARTAWPGHDFGGGEPLEPAADRSG